MASNSKAARKASSIQYVVVEASAADSTASPNTRSSVKNQVNEAESRTRRDVLIRQPSYCKILDDLKGTEAVMAKGQQQQQQAEVSTSDGEAKGASGVQTITINGHQYQIVAPTSIARVEGLQTIVATSPGSGGASSASSGGGVVQYAATSQNGQTVFIPGTVAAASSGGATHMIAVSGSGGGSSSSPANGMVTDEAVRKREIRLMKNREAARECRNKKKEYIKCLENRVAVLENQNKALIEELKSLKELYTGQKS